MTTPSKLAWQVVTAVGSGNQRISLRIDQDFPKVWPEPADI